MILGKNNVPLVTESNMLIAPKLKGQLRYIDLRIIILLQEKYSYEDTSR